MKSLHFFSLKNSSYFYFLLNATSAIFGVIYLFVSFYASVLDVFGFILLFTFFGNFLLIFQTRRGIKFDGSLGKKIEKLCNLYLKFVIIGNLLMFFGNFLISNTYDNKLFDLRNIGQTLLVLFGYFSILLAGLRLSFLNIKYYKSKDSSEVLNRVNHASESTSATDLADANIFNKKNILTTVKFSTGLIIGILLSYVIIVPLPSFLFMVGVFASQMGLFLGFVYLASTFDLASIKINRKYARFHKTAIIISSIITIICFLPVLSTPYSIVEADRNFGEAFGSDWRDRIDLDAQEFFLQREFTIPGYFLGVPEPEQNIIKNHISFFNITTGENEGVRLYFDAYLPPNNGIGLPGANSTLIRIHGGAWVLGDKGVGNMLQMNKYFASQGYVVFDIQYGLRKTSTPQVITPEYVRGNFTLEDMVSHVGEFTKYLIGNYEEFGANLDSVFISGGSAGGQLTLAAALAIASENYTSIFGSGLTIKGIIPFYPAIQTSNSSYIPGGNRPEFLNPGLLIEENAPPCLIFQGTHDSIITRAQIFTNEYKEKDNAVSLLLFPFAGHANDLYFSGYYNQVFLFYMERFMYLYR